MVIDYDIPSEQMSQNDIQVEADLQKTMQGMQPTVGQMDPNILEKQLKPVTSGGSNLGQ